MSAYQIAEKIAAEREAERQLKLQEVIKQQQESRKTRDELESIIYEVLREFSGATKWRLEHDKSRGQFALYRGKICDLRAYVASHEYENLMLEECREVIGGLGLFIELESKDNMNILHPKMATNCVHHHFSLIDTKERFEKMVGEYMSRFF